MTQDEKLSHSCLVCGRETANPRFCSRSCAAKHNNKTSPKRRPEGRCTKCGTPIPSSKTHCNSCAATLRAAREQEAHRRSQNIKSWTKLDGVRTEAPIPRGYSSKSVVFTNSFGQHSLRVTDTAGALIDRLLGICFECPGYLRPIHARRHIVLLSELRDFTFELYQWQSQPRKVKVAEITISKLNQALERWVFSFFDPKYCPIMPSLALDTTRFLQFHVEGFDAFDPEHWHIEPMLPISDNNNRDLIRFVSSTFKREFTQQMGTLRVSATVPADCHVTDIDGKKVLGPGDEFLFNSDRCHLSSGFYDHTYLDCKESETQPFDLHEEFRFMGAAFMSKSGRFATKRDLLETSDLDFQGLKMELPAYWVDSVVKLPRTFPYDATETPKIIDIPRWEAEVST